MARLKGLQAELKIWPLLRGSVEVDRFVLVEPEFHLEVDAAGRPNWALGAPATGEAPQQARPLKARCAAAAAACACRSPSSSSATSASRTARSPSRRQERHRRSASRRSTSIVDLPDLQSPLAAKGSLAYKGKPVELALAVERPLALLQGGSSPVRVSGKGPDLALTFEGALDNAATPHAAGAIDLNVTSIRDLAAWLGAADRIRRPGPEDVSPERPARRRADPDRPERRQARPRRDRRPGRGRGRPVRSGAAAHRPARPRRGRSQPIPAARGRRTAAATAGRAGAARGPGGAAPGGWSDEPIALPPIGGANVDFALSTEALKVRDLQLDRSRLALRLAGHAPGRRCAGDRALRRAGQRQARR